MKHLYSLSIAIAVLTAIVAAYFYHAALQPQAAPTPAPLPPSTCPARAACSAPPQSDPRPPQNAQTDAMDRQFSDSVPQLKDSYYDKLTDDTTVDDFRKCSNYGLELTPTVSWLRPVSLTGPDIMAKLFFDAERVFANQKNVLETDLQKFCMLETAKNIDRVLLDQFYADAAIAVTPADFTTRVEPVDDATVAILIDTGAPAPVRVLADAAEYRANAKLLTDQALQAALAQTRERLAKKFLSRNGVNLPTATPEELAPNLRKWYQVTLEIKDFKTFQCMDLAKNLQEKHGFRIIKKGVS